METTEGTKTRERRISYYVTQKPVTFKTKKEVEDFLNKEGGLKEGQILLKGATVEAQKEQVFKVT